jgi:hypothetical protein
MTLHLVPVRSRDAIAYVAAHHRHLAPPPGMLWAVGVADDNEVLRGVAVVGRPVARHLDTGQCAEVTRCATDGTEHAPSMLYGACWRAARALGYTRLITYTQAPEPGTSLKAAGWRVIAERPAHAGWSRPSRPRTDRGSAGIQRTLWEATG